MQRLSFFLNVCVAVSLAACSESNDGASSGTTSEGDPVTTPVDDEDDEDEQEEEEEEDPGDDPPASCARGGENDDIDQDGFTPAQGDCEDCSAEINPAAYDFPGDKWDEDCSGSPAEAAEDNCDQGLAMGSTAAEDAARSIGLCKFVSASDKGWGVLSARFTTSDGSGTLEDPLMVGLLPKFGALEPRAGASMLALSSGVARAPGQTGYTEDCDIFRPLCEGQLIPAPGCLPSDGTAPSGYPKESTSCGGNVTPGSGANDQAALEVTIRVPSNAKSYAFDSIFYSYEYPNWICSAFNDFFVVFAEPKPAGVSDGNILFDENGDPIGVNNGLLTVCDPSVQTPGAAKTFDCPQGTALLQGTGFGRGEAICGGVPTDIFSPPDPHVGAASTGWLHTTAPVTRSSVITLRFAIWDTDDEFLDSTALIDNFLWSVEEPNVETTPVVL